MTDQSLTVDTLAAFYGDIGKVLDDRGISLSEAARRSNFSKSHVGRMRNPNTKRLIWWSSIEKVLRACDVPADTREDFKRRHEALSQRRRARPATTVLGKDPMEQPTTSSSWYRRRRPLLALAGVAALLVGIAVWAGQPEDNGPSLVVLPAPSNINPNTAGCAPQTTWHTTFNPDYYGEIAVLVFSPHGVQQADVHMTWGRFQRDDTVKLNPGDLTTKTGGTLWRAHKRDRGKPSPGLVVHASVPVCVTFSTAPNPPIVPSLVIPADEGWY